MTCPEGTIERAGYKATRSDTKKTYRVKPACIKDVGKPGKTPADQKIVTDHGMNLGAYGYKDVIYTKSDERHKALQKAIQEISASKGKSEHDVAVQIMRWLNLLYVFSKNSHKKINLVLYRDRNWIGRTYLGKDYTA